MVHGPPALPSAMVANALRCSGVAFSSTSTIIVTLPLCSGPGECAAQDQLSPSNSTFPNCPLSMCQAYPPSQNPCVGGASKLQGQPQSQLHAPNKVPFIDHFVAT